MGLIGDREVRGYTHVDHVLAQVGNRWFEREYGRFLGTTCGLRHKAAGREWVAAQNPEFWIDRGEERIGIMDFGEVEIAERYDSLGAALTVTRRRPGLEVYTVVTALHDLPVMTKETRIAVVDGRTTEPWTTALEAIRLEPDDVELIARISTAGTEPAWPRGGTVAALQHAGTGWLVASTGAVDVTLEDEHFIACANLVDGASATLLMSPYEGEASFAAQEVLSRYLKQIRGFQRDAARNHEGLDA